MHVKRITFAASFILLLTGCGGSNHGTFPVSGVVKFTDGKPLTQGTIEFELSGTEPMTATGVIGPDGQFALGTFGVDDGALPGKYIVTIFAEPIIGTGGERPDRIERSSLHPRYQDMTTSKISKTVEEKENYFEIEVEYAPQSQ